MLKEKLDPKLIAATVAAVLLAVAAVFLLFPGALSFGNKQDAEPVVVADTAPVVQAPPKVVVSKPVVSSKPTLPKPVPEVKKVDTVKPPSGPAKNEAVARIEAKLRLKKPQTPDQVGEYLPLVYWACREIGRIGDRERALQWVEEGLSFSADASFFAYGAYLDYRQGRAARAQIKAEAALAAPAYLDRQALPLARSVLALLRNPDDSAARSITSLYE